MSDATARWALPFILPGQAQKELYHNEALVRLDAAVSAAVEEGPRIAPPIAPVVGQCWIVAANATEAWSRQSGRLACWTDGGWRFIAAQPGMKAWNKTSSLWLYWNGAQWSDGGLPATKLMIGGQQVVAARQAAITAPSGGTTVDLEARVALNKIIATLMSHGLIG